MATRTVINSLAVLFLATGAARSVEAEGWTDKMFDTTSHDFGYVARGKLKKTFTITNTQNQRVHIMSATPSCSVCTVAKPEKDWLEPGESTILEAVLDAHRFSLRKDVSIEVVFDRPQYGRTRLSLTAVARTDIVLSPGEFAFGTVKRGTTKSATMKIDYAGDSNWKIQSATSLNSAFEEPVLEEVQRGSGRVSYLLKLNLKDEASPGSIRDRIMLTINDAYNKTIDVPVQAFIQADVSISPATLSVGSVPAGSPMTKQVLVRGVRQFKITAIERTDGPFEIDRPDEAKMLHVLAVTLKPGHEPGDVSQQFTITTDMEGEKPLKLTVSAKLLEEKPAARTTSQ